MLYLSHLLTLYLLVDLMTILDSSLHIAALGQSSAVVLRSFQLSDRSQDIGPLTMLQQIQR